MDTTSYCFDEHGVVLMGGTRCASTSMKYAIADSVGLVNEEGIPNKHPYFRQRKISQVTAMVLKRNGFPVIGACRHPVERMISTYNFLVRRKYIYNGVRRLGVNEDDTFDSFLDKIIDKDPAKIDIHVTTLFHLQSYKGVFLPDAVIRFEDLDTGWKTFKDWSKVRVPDLWKTNHAVGYFEPTKSQITKIEKFYAIDFETFGYE